MTAEQIGILTIMVMLVTGMPVIFFMLREDRRRTAEALKKKNEEIQSRQQEILDKLEPIRYFGLHRHNERSGPLTREGMDMA